MEHGSRKNRREAAALSPQEQRAATIRAVTNIVRRMGVVLNAALDVTINQLLQQEMLSTAEALRDELKPLCDNLIHFTYEGYDDGEA